MIIRQALNFTVHMAAGMAMGALAIAACRALKRRSDEQWSPAEPPDRVEETIEAS